MADGTMKKFPKDVVYYILLKVPVKSLLRFKCVSKTWYKAIQSSNFIKLHLSRITTANDEFILFKRSYRKESDEFKSVMSFLSSNHGDDDLRPVSPDLDVPYLTTSSSCVSHRIIGPCNGLILLTDNVTDVLFNPTTRNYRLVQPSPFGCPFGFHRLNHCVGFGVDLIANDHKIVKISVVRGEPPFYCDTMREWKVEVYELSIDSWRELDQVDQHLAYVHWYPCSEMFYKGAAHWFAVAVTVVILSFDISTETFRNIKMPSTCHTRDEKCYGLVVLNESLTLICYPYPGKVIDPTTDFMDIWMMKEYGVNESWIRKYTIAPLSIESPLAFWKDHLLLLQSRKGVLISYDVKSDEIKELNLHGWPESLRVTIYKESLTLIPKGSQHNPQVQ